jgi:hypothetical protein
MVTNTLIRVTSGPRLFLLIALCFYLSFLKAQNDSSTLVKPYKGHIIFSFGLAEPLGDLALQDYSKSYAGAANTGPAFQLALYKPFTRNFGFCIAFHRESFLINAEEIAKMNQRYLNPGYKASVDVLQNWSVSGLQLGAFAQGTLNTKKTFFLESRILFGLARAKSPGYTLTIDSVVPKTEPIVSATQLSTRSSNLSGTFLIGMGLRYHTKNNWCYSLHLEYETFFAEAEFDDIQITTSTNQSATVKGDMEMKYYTFKLGIGKLFGN